MSEPDHPAEQAGFLTEEEKDAYAAGWQARQPEIDAARLEGWEDGQNRDPETGALLTATLLEKEINARIEAARREGMEAAAKIAESKRWTGWPDEYTSQREIAGESIADAIRSQSGGPSE